MQIEKTNQDQKKMACVLDPQRIENADSEMEEGEIVDDIDDLSDISSEEEFLLRQRLQVLENYNNVLERKNAKRTSVGSGVIRSNIILEDVSDISGTEFDDVFPNSKPTENGISKNLKDVKHNKSHKQKRKKDIVHQYLNKDKEHKRKGHRKKKLQLKVISESSEESDDEYRNKRRKLANAVVVNKTKNDTSSLQARLQKMLCSTKIFPSSNNIETVDKQTETDCSPKLEDVSCSPIVPKPIDVPTPDIKIITPNNAIGQVGCELIDLCTDDDVTMLNNDIGQDAVDAVGISENETVDKKEMDGDSDDDLEILRQCALKTKASKPKPVVALETENKPLTLSEDEDSDTAELRLICLKSALLKKAIEVKRKQKLRKRLSQSCNLDGDLFNVQDEFKNKVDKVNSENNTDIESVDMDIGSDADDRIKDLSNENVTNMEIIHTDNQVNKKEMFKPKEDELEEDEDLLRARLLTSLSKNLPNLVNPNIINTLNESENKENKQKDLTPATVMNTKTIPENRIIINVGESDSEGEHEATKNLTKMHLKLSEQLDFQQKLDIFLKSTRNEVEKEKLPDVVQQSAEQKTPQKFVAKAVNHLPKSEQLEYKNLVKRMAELEKIKQARQSSMIMVNKVQLKETLKPRNVSVDPTKLVTNNNIEEQIALSRKKIAEESAKMLKLKEEGTKLSQRYKIVATELKNIATAITLNKKEQRSAHNRLSKIRIQHQRLLSSTSKHSKTNGHSMFLNQTNKNKFTSKMQKENNPSKDEYKNPEFQKSVMVSVMNDRKEETSVPTRLSVEVDVSSNEKIVKVSNCIKNRTVDMISTENSVTVDNIVSSKENYDSLQIMEGDGDNESFKGTSLCQEKLERRKEFDDYKSPLQALGKATWEADPHAILCPFEVGGHCKDPECKYLHPKIPTT